ncbi:MAG: heavy metal translocating P-type ATPase, partial [Bacillota bacterium]
MTAAAAYAGIPVVKEAWGRLLHKRFSIPLLITVASAGALWIGEVWEAAAVTFLYRFGAYLESLTLNRTRAALRELLDLRPMTALVRRGGHWREIPAEDVGVGGIIFVPPGRQMPRARTVFRARARFAQSALRGR